MQTVPLLLPCLHTFLCFVIELILTFFFWFGEETNLIKSFVFKMFFFSVLNVRILWEITEEFRNHPNHETDELGGRY